MSHKGIIVVKDAGLLMDQEFIRRAHRENPSTLGVATFNDKSQLTLIRGVKAFPLKDICGANETLKSNEAVFFFGTYDNDTLIEDRQPFFVLQQDEKTPRLLAFLEGNFEKYASKDGSKHTPEYFAFMELQERVKDYDDLLGGDMDKLFTHLGKDTVYRDITNGFSDRGTITLIGNNGKIKSFYKNDLARKFSWGWVSNHCGVLEASKEEPAEPINSLLAALDGTAEPAPRSAEPVGRPSGTAKAGEVAPVISAVHTPPATETAVTQKGRMIQCPENVKAKNRANWYQKNGGWCPPNAETRPLVMSRLDASGNQFSEKRAELEEIAAKTEERKAAEAEVHDETSDPVLSAKDKEELEELLTHPDTTAILDRHSKLIQDPKQLEDYMKKIPDFAQAAGLEGMSVTYGWPFEHLMNIGMVNTKSLALLAFSWRNQSLHLRSQLNETLAKYGTNDGKQPVVEAETSSSEAPKKAKSIQDMFKKRTG